MYFVALTLQGKPEQYENLYNAIKALGPWSNRMPATWLVHSRVSASRIRDQLKPHLQSGDRLFVAQFGKNWAGTGMGTGFPEWLNRRAFEPGETDGTATGTQQGPQG
jgi:hypothetical protein